MKLTLSEKTMFFNLWFTLIWSVNCKQNIVSNMKKPIFGERVDIKRIAEIRDKLWENPQWIDDFLRDTDYELTETERNLLISWRKGFIKNHFFIVKHQSEYSVFMPVGDSGELFGVCGVSDSFQEMLADYDIPILLETVLLPFNNKIIYDGILSPYANASFAKGAKDDIRMTYNKIRDNIGIIEQIGKPPKSNSSASKTKQQNSTAKQVNVPTNMLARYTEVAQIIETFCDEKLSVEYKEICLHALQTLCRKRPSPIAFGVARTWACGIVYAIGQCNFIFDKTQPVNMTAAEIYEWFGLSRSSAGNKAAETTRLLDLSCFNLKFLLKDIRDEMQKSLMLLRGGF